MTDPYISLYHDGDPQNLRIDIRSDAGFIGFICVNHLMDRARPYLVSIGRKEIHSFLLRPGQVNNAIVTYGKSTLSTTGYTAVILEPFK